MKEKRYTSGELAAADGLTVRTIQYYDNIGLLRSAGHSEGNRRYYTEDDLIRLEQIVLYKSLDFSLEQIKKQLLYHPSQEELFAKLLPSALQAFIVPLLPASAIHSVSGPAEPGSFEDTGLGKALLVLSIRLILFAALAIRTFRKRDL